MDESFCVEEISQLTVMLSKYILNNVQGKLPISQTNMKNITASKAINKKMFNKAFEHSKRFLSDTYGLLLTEVPKNKKYDKLYIATSTVTNGTNLDYDDRERSEETLLLLILSFIMMKNNQINEDTLWQYLNKIKISVETSHYYFGDNIKKLISETFVKQLYLKREKMKLVAAQEDEILYSWGFRSQIEFPKDKLLEFVANILEKPAICFVRQQLEILQPLQENVESE